MSDTNYKIAFGAVVEFTAGSKPKAFLTLGDMSIRIE